MEMTKTLTARTIFILCLAIFEIAVIAFTYEPANTNIVTLHSINKEFLFGKLQPFVLLFFFLFPILIWARRNDVFELWVRYLKTYPFGQMLIVNALCFTCLFVLTGVVSLFNPAFTLWLYGLNALWHISLLAMLASVLTIAAPLDFWFNFLKKFYFETALALLAALFIIGVATYSQSAWNDLSEATFQLSYWFLKLYESDVYLNASQRQLAVNGFLIRVDHQCSGYEGIGLIIAFVTVYIFAFRKSLKFPNIFILYFIGIPLIWVLNALRIALLASIGGHFSPQIAVTGFHSQAGWIMFLLVTVSIMLASSQMQFFRSDLPDRSDGRKADLGMELAVALLAPFIALMLASIVISALTIEGWREWLYGLKVLAVSVVLWQYRSVYARFVAPVSYISLLAGVFVAILWIAMDKYHGQQTELANWLAGLSYGGFILWFSVRLAGTVIIVPIAEELAFRSYLHRAFVGRRFENVAHNHFTWLAFLGTTTLFAAMHSGRFIEAFTAGAVFALVMYRTNRISDPVAAHMVANLIIAVWAVIFSQWSLL